MAQRRMFSKKITETDLFLDMPMSAQCLYFHLNMSADDDGFIGNVKTIRRMIGASEDDLKLLMAKEFLIPFDSGVVVIKDWKIHNYIRSDRYNETVYQEEKKQLKQLENGRYEVGIPNVIPEVYQMDTQVRLGKDRLGKDSEENTQPSNDGQSISERFEKIWKDYPNKQGKKPAFSSYKTALKNGATDKDIIEGLERYKQHLQQNTWKQAAQGSTWFKQNRWEDEFDDVVEENTTSAELSYLEGL